MPDNDVPMPLGSQRCALSALHIPQRRMPFALGLAFAVKKHKDHEFVDPELSPELTGLLLLAELVTLEVTTSPLRYYIGKCFIFWGWEDFLVLCCVGLLSLTTQASFPRLLKKSVRKIDGRGWLFKLVQCSKRQHLLRRTMRGNIINKRTG